MRVLVMHRTGALFRRVTTSQQRHALNTFTRHLFRN